jgi:hypothetical protein
MKVHPALLVQYHTVAVDESTVSFKTYSPMKAVKSGLIVIMDIYIYIYIYI